MRTFIIEGRENLNLLKIENWHAKVHFDDYTSYD
jgi:hypothetical protein